MAETLLGESEAAAPEATSAAASTASDTASEASPQAATATQETPDTPVAADGGDQGLTQPADAGKANDAEAATEQPDEGLSYDALMLPDGSGLEATVIGEVKDFAKANGLTLEAAQAVLERDSTRAAAADASWVTQAEGWAQTIHDDPALGGDKLPESRANAKAALAEYFSPEFAEELNRSGMGNHPELFRGLVSIYRKHLAEPSQLARGGQAASSDERVPVFANSPGMYPAGESGPQ